MQCTKTNLPSEFVTTTHNCFPTHGRTSCLKNPKYTTSVSNHSNSSNEYGNKQTHSNSIEQSPSGSCSNTSRSGTLDELNDDSLFRRTSKVQVIQND